MSRSYTSSPPGAFVACSGTFFIIIIIFFLFLLSFKAHQIYETPVSTAGIVPLHGAVTWFWHNFQLVCLYRELRKEGWMLFSLPLYASLGMEPRPQVMYTHIVPWWGPRWCRHFNSRVTIGLAVPLWHVTTDWELGCNEPQVPWSCAVLCSSAWCKVGGHGRLFP
jgi:hypothetical protein